MYNFVPDLFGADIILFITGVLLGWMIAFMDYQAGFQNGWDQGVEDVIAIMEGEEINEPR